MRITIDDKYIAKLIEKTGGDLTGTALTSDALGLLNWAMDEVAKGKKIVSVDAKTDLEKESQVVLQSLEAVKI